MKRFIALLNIEHYRKTLAAEVNDDRRQVVLRLLAEEEAKLAAMERSASRAAAADDDISRLNLDYYRKRLAAETDMVIRQILVRLIDEEEAKFASPDLRRTSGHEAG